MEVGTGSFGEIAVKTCFRCGVEFDGGSDRVCSQCRKPRAKARTESGGELTFRELQILRRVCQAKLNKEIAFDLRLTEGTIKEYMNRIFRKVAVKNRTELAMWGMRNLHIAT